MSLTQAEIKAKTFFYERRRSVAAGILETANSTFLMLIALRYYAASGEIKALVFSGGAIGLILSPFVVSLASWMKWKTTQAATIISVLGGFCYLAAAWILCLPAFAIGAVLGSICTSCAVPLFTQMMQDNYPTSERGHLFARAFMTRIISATVFSQLGGLLLSRHINYFSWLLTIYALSLFYSAFCFSQCPSKILKARTHNALSSGIKVMMEDAPFRRSMIAWTFLGFGSTMILSLRVEFLANPLYGLGLSATSIAVFTGVLPDLVRFIMSPVWGKIFDRLDIFMLQIILNLIFGSAYLMFFTGTHLIGLILGALIFGLASSGSDVAWSLWATKFATPERVAEYMSVHTFLAGLRSSSAPFAAFALLRYFSISSIALISSSLILASVVVVLLEFKNRRRTADLLAETTPPQI